MNHHINNSIVEFNTLYQKKYGSNPILPDPMITVDGKFSASYEICGQTVIAFGSNKREVRTNICKNAIPIISNNILYDIPNQQCNTINSKLRKWLTCDDYYKEFLLELGLETFDELYNNENKRLLFNASIHSSSLHILLKIDPNIQSNERFEWLGDRFLNYQIAKNLYNQLLMSLIVIQTKYTTMISNSYLNNIMNKTKIPKFLIHHDVNTQSKIMADYFEAIVGALSLINDKYASLFVKKHIIDKFDLMDSSSQIDTDILLSYKKLTEVKID